MKKAVLVITLFLLGTVMVGAQTPYHISVSQFVEHPALDAVLNGFQDYLKDQKVVVEYRVHNAQANMATAAQIASQILGEKPDLILSIATPTSQACVQAMKKVPGKYPLLFTAVTDPLSAGLVSDLQHPGGRITGVSDLLPIDKHIQMVKTFLPELKKLGVLYNAGEANSKKTVNMIRGEGVRLNFRVIEATVSKSSDVYQATKSLVGKVDAIFIPTDNTVVTALESAVKVCEQSQLPLFAADVDSVARGAIAAKGFDYYKHGYQTGAMAKKIFEGAEPGKMAVETQEELMLHLNLGAAHRMGISVPLNLKSTADKIYD